MYAQKSLFTPVMVLCFFRKIKKSLSHRCHNRNIVVFAITARYCVCASGVRHGCALGDIATCDAHRTLGCAAGHCKVIRCGAHLAQSKWQKVQIKSVFYRVISFLSCRNKTVVLIRHLFNPILSQKSAVRQYQILPILTDRFISALWGNKKVP